MKLRHTTFAILMFSAFPLQAWGAPATGEQADKIRAGLEAYIGKTPGVIEIKPSGEQYDLKIDLTPLVAKFAGSEAKFQASPWNFKITDSGGGKWQVVEDEPVSLSLEVGKNFSSVWKFGRIKSVSTYDEVSGLFIQSSAEVTDMVADQRMMTPEGVESNVHYVIRSLKQDIVSTADGDAVNSKITGALEGLEESFSMPLQPGSAPVPIKISASKGSQLIEFSGLRFKALKSLVTWIADHAGDKDIKGKEAELRKLAADALPLFNRLTMDGGMEQFSVETPVGPVSMGKLLVSVAMNGLVANGEFGESVSYEGLTLPAGLVPAFAADLVPQKAAVDFKVSDFDLAAASKLFIDEFDFSTDKQSPEFEAKMAQVIIPSGAVTMSTGGTSAVSKLYELSMSGSMKAGPAVPPGGKAAIKIKGLDAIAQALQAAPPEMGMAQVIGGLMMAKGFGKTEADVTSWDIEATAGGAVLINGIDVSKMAGAPAQ